MIQRLAVETLARSLPFYYAFIDDIIRPYPGLYRRDREGHYLKSWGAILSMGMGEIFLSADGDTPLGALYATVTPDLFDGDLIATEHAWYVRKSVV